MNRSIRSRIALTHWRDAHQLLTEVMPVFQDGWEAVRFPQGMPSTSRHQGITGAAPELLYNLGSRLKCCELGAWSLVPLIWTGRCFWWNGGKMIIILQELHGMRRDVFSMAGFSGFLAVALVLSFPYLHQDHCLLGRVCCCHDLPLSYVFFALQTSITSHVTSPKLWWFQVLLPVCRFYRALACLLCSGTAIPALVQ